MMDALQSAWILALFGGKAILLLAAGVGTLCALALAIEAIIDLIVNGDDPHQPLP